MKKRIISLLLVTMMVASVAGCGDNKKDENVEGTEAVAETEEGTEDAAIISASSAFDIKGSDYVTLCDYSAVDVTVSGDYEVEDNDVTDYFQQMFANYGPFYAEDTEKTTVGEGDIVNVDYVGKLDDVAFDGGTAENQNIDVYNNSAAGGTNGYIEGFTEDLKGASVGDVIDSNVTFPENYTNTDLAGKEVVFTFTINSIQKEMTIDEVDDAFAKEQFQVDTVDEMYSQIQTYLEQMAEYNKQKDTYTAVQDYLIANCTVEVPNDYLSARLADYKRQFLETNCNGDEKELENYASTYYGTTADELEQSWVDGMTDSISLELIMDAIVEEMGLTINEDEYATYMDSMVTNSGYGSAEVLYQMYGYGDAAFGEKYMRDLYLYDQALDTILDTTNVTVTAAEDTEATEAAEAVENTEE